MLCIMTTEHSWGIILPYSLVCYSVENELVAVYLGQPLNCSFTLGL